MNLEKNIKEIKLGLFGKFSHNFDDCVKKNWDNFTINSPSQTNYVECIKTPYQTIDSGCFMKK